MLIAEIDRGMHAQILALICLVVAAIEMVFYVVLSWLIESVILQKDVPPFRGISSAKLLRAHIEIGPFRRSL